MLPSSTVGMRGLAICTALMAASCGGDDAVDHHVTVTLVRYNQDGGSAWLSVAASAGARAENDSPAIEPGTCAVVPYILGAPTDVGRVWVTIGEPPRIFGTSAWNNFYPATRVDPELLVPQVPLVFSAAGATYPGFTGESTFPSPLETNLPPRDDPPLIVRRQDPLTIRWVPDGIDGDLVSVSVGQGSGGCVCCVAEDDAGTITVPSELLRNAGFIDGEARLYVDRFHSVRFVENGGDILLWSTSSNFRPLDLRP